MHEGERRILTECFGLLSVRPSEGGVLLEPVEVVRHGGETQKIDGLEGAVDAVARDGVAKAFPVVVTQALQRVDLLGPAREPVVETVRDRGLDETAVTARRRPADATTLDEDDVAQRIGLLGQQRCPETGEAATDHEQVGVAAPGKGLQRLGAARVVEPEGHRRRIGDRGVGRGTRGACEGHDSHAFAGGRPGSSGRYDRHERAGLPATSAS